MMGTDIFTGASRPLLSVSHDTVLSVQVPEGRNETYMLLNIGRDGYCSLLSSKGTIRADLKWFEEEDQELVKKINKTFASVDNKSEGETVCEVCVSSPLLRRRKSSASENLFLRKRNEAHLDSVQTVWM